MASKAKAKSPAQKAPVAPGVKAAHKDVKAPVEAAAAPASGKPVKVSPGKAAPGKAVTRPMKGTTAPAKAVIAKGVTKATPKAAAGKVPATTPARTRSQTTTSPKTAAMARKTAQSTAVSSPPPAAGVFGEDGEDRLQKLFSGLGGDRTGTLEPESFMEMLEYTGTELNVGRETSKQDVLDFFTMIAEHGRVDFAAFAASADKVPTLTKLLLRLEPELQEAEVKAREQRVLAQKKEHRVAIGEIISASGEQRSHDWEEEQIKPLSGRIGTGSEPTVEVFEGRGRSPQHPHLASPLSVTLPDKTSSLISFLSTTPIKEGEPFSLPIAASPAPSYAAPPNTPAQLRPQTRTPANTPHYGSAAPPNTPQQMMIGPPSTPEHKGTLAPPNTPQHGLMGPPSTPLPSIPSGTLYSPPRTPFRSSSLFSPPSTPLQNGLSSPANGLMGPPSTPVPNGIFVPPSPVFHGSNPHMPHVTPAPPNTPLHLNTYAGRPVPELITPRESDSFSNENEEDSNGLMVDADGPLPNQHTEAKTPFNTPAHSRQSSFAQDDEHQVAPNSLVTPHNTPVARGLRGPSLDKRMTLMRSVSITEEDEPAASEGMIKPLFTALGGADGGVIDADAFLGVVNACTFAVKNGKENTPESVGVFLASLSGHAEGGVDIACFMQAFSTNSKLQDLVRKLTTMTYDMSSSEDEMEDAAMVKVAQVVEEGEEEVDALDSATEKEPSEVEIMEAEIAVVAAAAELEVVTAEIELEVSAIEVEEASEVVVEKEPAVPTARSATVTQQAGKQEVAESRPLILESRPKPARPWWSDLFSCCSTNSATD